LPKLEDRLARFGFAGVGVRCTGFTGLVGLADQTSRVVREPSGESAVGVRITQFGEDSLAKSDEGVSVP
jgi:hypothetical protein